MYVHVKNWNFLFYCSNIAKSENAMLWRMLSRLETCIIYSCIWRVTLAKWDNILFSTINQEKLFNFGNGYISYIKENVVKNKFWKDVFHAWNTFIDKEENFTWEYFLSSPLWMNKTIKIENKPVFYEDWFRKGICFVNDIMSEDGKFLSIDQLEEKFNISKILWNLIV